jgi:hypothetical protein
VLEGVIGNRPVFPHVLRCAGETDRSAQVMSAGGTAPVRGLAAWGRHIVNVSIGSNAAPDACAEPGAECRAGVM